MSRVWCGVILFVLAALTTLHGQADEPTAGKAVITDLDGKEYKLSGLKLSAGTRRLTWLADPAGETEDAKKGPFAIAFREPHSTTLKDGITTFVPAASIESIRYEFEKQFITLDVKGLSQPLTGILGFQSINVLGISGMVDGKAASFTGGIRGKPTVKTVSFGGAVPVPRKKVVTTWNVQIVQPKAENPTVTVRNLKALYSTGTGEQLANGLSIRKGEPVQFDEKLKRFEMLATDPNTNFSAAEIETSSGPERVVGIPLTADDEKKSRILIGLLGEVDAGWKLFPLHTIKVIKPSMRKIE